VSEFLDDEWIASWVGTGRPPGPTATVQVVVTGTGVPNDGKWHLRLDDGVVAEAAAGTVATPDLTLTVGYPEGAAMAAGELDPSVAFMQGRLKTAGDPGLVLDVLAGAAQAR
jgi:SCP-2 sterol transfer family